MPTYEYACTACGQHLEVFQRLTDDSLTKCEACGGVLRKVFHPAGIVFKGSGFYATDSRSGSKSTSTSSAPASAGSSDSGSDGGGSGSSSSAPASETKPKTGEKATAAPAPATEAAK